jgi:foldase protein PrsA
MKNVKKIISAALLTIFSASLIGCNMIEKTPEGVAKSVVAKVFDVKITRGQVDEQLAAAIKQLETQYGANYQSNAEAMEQLKAQKQQVLEGMITEKIILHKAEELKITPTEAKLNEEVNKQLADIKKSFETDAKYKEALTQANLTEEALKARIKPSVIQDAVYNEVTKAVKVDEAKKKEYYDSNLTQFTEKPNRIHAAHILVPTEEEAKAIKKRLDAGETFAALAKEKGTDGTKDNGGDLGWVEYNTTEMDKTFMTAAITVPVGQVSAPVKTQFGWHLIKAIEKEEFAIKKFETVKAEIEKTLLSQEKGNVWTESMKKWQEEAKIKKYEKNL